ncbi:hypothetical protein CR513_21115, partial [Mucuna pruriens]
MKAKSETRKHLQFVIVVKTQFNLKIKIIRSDTGQEFSKHQHILNVGQALPFQANLPIPFLYAITHAVHLTNILPSTELHNFLVHYALLPLTLTAKNQFGPDWLWESMIRRETGADSNGSGGGKKNSSNGVAYESAVGPATTVKSEPFIEENEAAMYPPPIKNVGSSSHSIMIKLEPFDTETSEIQPHAMEENDAGRDAKILKFDLNEVPADGGEE